MISQFVRQKPRDTAFLFAVLCALLFALHTNHVLEDYFITYPSSKHLATGHGLVFNEGDNGSMAKDWTFWSDPEIR